MRFILILIFAMTICLATGPAAAASFLITADGNGAYPTIQAGVDNISSGDTLLLEGATFTGAGNNGVDYLGKAIVISGDPGGGTVIDCGTTNRGFEFTSGSPVAGLTVLENVTITNGNATALSPFSGGGILISSGNDPTIRNVTIENCRAVFGGGIAVEDFGTEPDITACEIRNCVGESSNEYEGGGGIFVRQASPTIIDCDIHDNDSNGSGGGLLLIGGAGEASGSYSANRIYNNSAFRGGGGIAIEEGGTSLFVFDNLIYGNDASNGGGMDIFDVVGGLVETNTVAENSASGGLGGGVRLRAAVITRTIVAFNTGGTNSVDCGINGVVNCSVIWNPGLNDTPACNISDIVNADPQFCGDLGSFNYQIQSDSPAAAANSPGSCARIGALDVGCSTSPVVPTTWGGLKSLYR